MPNPPRLNPPRRWRRALLGVGVTAIVIGLLLYALRGPIALRLAERQIDRLAALVDPIGALADGLHVGLCGTGSPMVDARHGGPCTVVIAGRRMFVFDAGPGSAAVLSRMRLNPGQLEAVFLTHFHSDHIGGLADLMLQRWVAASSREPLPIFGPPGVTRVIVHVTAGRQVSERGGPAAKRASGDGGSGPRRAQSRGPFTRPLKPNTRRSPA